MLDGGEGGNKQTKKWTKIGPVWFLSGPMWKTCIRFMFGLKALMKGTIFADEAVLFFCYHADVSATGF